MILFRIETIVIVMPKQMFPLKPPYYVELKYIFLPDDCNSDWLLFEGNCYFFGVRKLSLAEAQVYFIYIIFFSKCIYIYMAEDGSNALHSVNKMLNCIYN